MKCLCLYIYICKVKIFNISYKIVILSLDADNKIHIALLNPFEKNLLLAYLIITYVVNSTMFRFLCVSYCSKNFWSFVSYKLNLTFDFYFAYYLYQYAVSKWGHGSR